MTTGQMTAALLFADMEGSTRLLTRLGEQYATVLADYRRLLSEAVTGAGGGIADTEGDGLFAVFSTAGDAVRAAVVSQRALAGHDWPDGAVVKARMGLHVGDIRTAVTGYVGLAIHAAARVAAAAHGGQVLATASVVGLAGSALPPDVSLRDLGEHRLKDIDVPERLFQIDVEGLPDDFPPPRGVAGRQHNLPAPLSSFVGRETELGVISDLLDDGHRLVTLTGPGGAGKTRLALHVAASRLDSYRDGVWLADLSASSKSDQVAAVIAKSIGVVQTRTGEVVDQILRRLADAHMLLLVDNCEHLLPTAAHVVEQIIRAAPGVTVMATSRAPLEVRGEATYSVRSLGLPPESASPEATRMAPAVRLLLDRAASARPDLMIDDDTVAALAEVCRRLDGIPLALELAAARTRVLSPQQLLDRLDGAFTVLGSGDRSRPTRQRTLRATLDWSFGLLTETQRVLLRRLSVFTGGFTIEAAERVCAAGPLAFDDVLDALDQLVASSVVAAAEWTDPRYRMLRTVRSYARHRLDEAQETDAIAAAHAAYYRDVVSGGGQGLGQRDQALWLAGLEADHDNFRAALRWSIDVGDTATAVGLAGDLVLFWYRRGYYAEARAWIDEILDLQGLEASLALANVLRFAAATAIDAGESERAQAMAGRAATVARDLADPVLLARSLNVRSGIEWRLGELAAALDHYLEAISLLEGRSEPFLVNLLVNRTVLLIDMGRLDAAAASFAAFRVADFSEENVDLRRVEATLLHACDDLDTAEAALITIVESYRDLGLVPNLASALLTRAEVARASGRLEDAHAHATEAVKVFDDIDDPFNAAEARIILAGVAVDSGSSEDARLLLASTVEALHRAGRRKSVYAGLVEFERLAAVTGDWVRLAHLHGATRALADSFPLTETGATRRALDRIEGQAMAELGEAVYRSEVEKGASMTLDEVVAYTVEGA